MRILVTGATGLVGRSFVRAMVERDHEIIATSRDPQRATGYLPLITRHVQWDPNDGPAPAAAFEGVDAIVHLAGEPVAGRWTEAKKQRIRDSRVNGTRNLVDGLRPLDDRPFRLVCASAIGFYGERGDEVLTEESAPGDDFLATTCVEWESEGAAARELDVEVAHLRLGIVLDPAGGALEQMLPPFKLGVGGPLGSGRQWWSWIHRDDLTAMLIAAVEDGWSGTYNATAPNAQRQRDFATVLGSVLDRPSIAPAPEFALRLLFGEFATELLTSKNVRPLRALEEGFDFRFAELHDALIHLLD